MTPARTTGRLGRYLGLARRRAREGHASTLRQLLEIGYLRARNGTLTSTYFAAGLYRSTIPWSEKRDYVWGEPYQRLLRRCNDRFYDFVVLNKVVTQALLDRFGVPTPPFYGLLNRVDGQTAGGSPLRTAEDLEALIRREALDELCFKPVGGFGGIGFHKVRITRGPQVMVGLQNEDALVPLAEFWTARLYPNGGPSYVCQAVIQQHPQVAQIHPLSINTARIWMSQPERGMWRMYAGVLRMGVGSMLVDNSTSGGIASGIDIATGALGPAIDMMPERGVCDAHPTTNVQLTGRILPMWDEVAALCMRACRAFPFFRLLGLDVAFGGEAPLIIEVESRPDPEHQMGFGHGCGSALRELALRGTLDWRC